jgi:hypothetical protein
MKMIKMKKPNSNKNFRAKGEVRAKGELRLLDNCKSVNGLEAMEKKTKKKEIMIMVTKVMINNNIIDREPSQSNHFVF